MAQVPWIPSPREDLDGRKIRSVYYEEGDVERIVRYCELDGITTAQVFRKFRNKPLPGAEQTAHVYINADIL